MARIELNEIAHSYLPKPGDDADFALKRIQHTWEDGGAYALLGPSGCGKTTLLNIISGLLTPTRGRVLYDGNDVTALPPEKRNIAQVFQFPVLYDTMSVFDNLAFPLRNRGLQGRDVDRRVRDVLDDGLGVFAEIGCVVEDAGLDLVKPPPDHLGMPGRHVGALPGIGVDVVELAFSAIVGLRALVEIADPPVGIDGVHHDLTLGRVALVLREDVVPALVGRVVLAHG